MEQLIVAKKLEQTSTIGPFTAQELVLAFLIAVIVPVGLGELLCLSTLVRLTTVATLLLLTTFIKLYLRFKNIHPIEVLTYYMQPQQLEGSLLKNIQNVGSNDI